MQGRQRIKDIVSALTDTEDIDHQLRARTLNTTLQTLLNQQYLRTVSWYNIMPPEDLHNKITIEEEKKVRGGDTTSASLSAKNIKLAATGTAERLKAMKGDDKVMEGVKRKASEMVDLKTHRAIKKRRGRYTPSDDEEEEATLDLDVCPDVCL
jgi:hypothetical protein